MISPSPTILTLYLPSCLCPLSPYKQACQIPVRIDKLRKLRKCLKKQHFQGEKDAIYIIQAKGRRKKNMMHYAEIPAKEGVDPPLPTTVGGKVQKTLLKKTEKKICVSWYPENTGVGFTFVWIFNENHLDVLSRLPSTNVLDLSVTIVTIKGLVLRVRVDNILMHFATHRTPIKDR